MRVVFILYVILLSSCTTRTPRNAVCGAGCDAEKGGVFGAWHHASPPTHPARHVTGPHRTTAAVFPVGLRAHGLRLRFVKPVERGVLAIREINPLFVDHDRP